MLLHVVNVYADLDATNTYFRLRDVHNRKIKINKTKQTKRKQHKTHEQKK